MSMYLNKCLICSKSFWTLYNLLISVFIIFYTTIIMCQLIYISSRMFQDLSRFMQNIYCCTFRSFTLYCQNVSAGLQNTTNKTYRAYFKSSASKLFKCCNEISRDKNMKILSCYLNVIFIFNH